MQRRNGTESLEERLNRMEAAEEIRWMKAYYAQVCDDKFTDAHVPRPQAEIDAMMRPMVERVFAEDATWAGFPDGRIVQGREAIFQRLRLSAWSFAMHYYVNPMIEVQGDRATARWMLWEPCTRQADNTALWMSAITEDAYINTPQGWRLQHYRVRYRFLTPFDQPWSRTASLSGAFPDPSSQG